MENKLPTCLPRVVFFLALFLPSTFIAAAQTPQSVEPANSATVYVTPAGLPPSALTLDPSQVNITIDGNPAQLLSSRKADADPILFAVVVDASTSQARIAPQVRMLAAMAFKSLAGATGHGYLVTFDQVVTASRTPLSPDEAAATLEKVQFGGGTALFDAVKKTSDILGRNANPGSFHRVMVLLSDGDENQSAIRRGDVIKAADQEGIPIFAISTNTNRDEANKVLEELTRATGGEVLASMHLDQDLARAVNAIHGQWAFTLASPSLLVKGWHKLSVKPLGNDVQISAPAWIFTP